MADQLGKDPATVSKWCTNYSQPSLETLVQVAEALDVDVRSLIVQTKKSRIEIEAEKLLNIAPTNKLNAFRFILLQYDGYIKT